MRTEPSEEIYEGYEMGPIRPPSEAASLLLRVTRNCPWNQCRFCTLYKGERFSIRQKEHIFRDIDTIRELVNVFQETADDPELRRSRLSDLKVQMNENHRKAYQVAINWYRSGMKSVFLQDANCLIMKPADLAEVLRYVRSCFPHIERITSYARSHTVARIRDEDLQELAAAGLNRIHIGMETACNEVLDRVRKGADKDIHIAAGQKIKRTTMELSEYYMPGLGGTAFSRESALETADAMNRINPDYIRIRTLAIPMHSRLHEDYQAGVFTRSNDVQMVQELLWFIENLQQITSTVKSDHILNLLPEVEGELPKDQNRILAVLRWFLALPAEEQLIFRVGRRTGVMTLREDLENEARRNRVHQMIMEAGITAENIDQFTDTLIQRFI
jgi:radical SAM superfamily enzyme YgiQ (UPF0313 family)